MTLLMDTHTILWYWWDQPKLSKTARSVIADETNRKLVSHATAWEVAIKVGQKKLTIGRPYLGFFPEQMDRSGFEWLPTRDAHYAAITTLPEFHKDPFDRLLIAQALVEQIPIVSIDDKNDRYGVSRIW